MKRKPTIRAASAPLGGDARPQRQRHARLADPMPVMEQPFAEGVNDELDPELRHRLISECAFHHLAERGFAEGSEVEDWSEAQAEVDHTLVQRRKH